jgi:hypothetical protein
MTGESPPWADCVMCKEVRNEWENYGMHINKDS